MIAYIGPGPGVGMLGALLALLLTIFGAIFAALWWPIRRLWERLTGADEDSDNAADEESADAEDEELSSESKDESDAVE